MQFCIRPSAVSSNQKLYFGKKKDHIISLCSTKPATKNIVKWKYSGVFWQNTAIAVLISNITGDDTMYVSRSGQHNHSPLFVNGKAVKIVTRVEILGLSVTDELSWSTVSAAEWLEKLNSTSFFWGNWRAQTCRRSSWWVIIAVPIESVQTHCAAAWLFSCHRGVTRELSWES